MDREKVIKGLECCLGANDCDVEPKEDCPYKGMCLCAMTLRLDVCALLKEQETAKLYKCPNCGTWVSAENVVRCKDCKYGYCINPSCDEKEKIYECMKYPIANLRITHKPDWFCGDGKRRIDNAEQEGNGAGTDLAEK